MEESLYDHMMMLNGSWLETSTGQEESSEITPFEVPNYIYKYSLKNPKKTTYWYKQVRVTAFGEYPTTINFAASVVTNESWSISLGASTLDIKNLLRVNVGVNWSTSSSISSSYGASHTVAKGTCAAIYFTPKGRKVEGDTYKDTYSQSGVYFSSQYLGKSWGTTPLKLSNGLTDGSVSVVSYTVSECVKSGLINPK